MWVVMLMQRQIETTGGLPVQFEADGMIGFLPVFAFLQDAKAAYPKADLIEVKEAALKDAA